MMATVATVRHDQQLGASARRLLLRFLLDNRERVQFWHYTDSAASAQDIADGLIAEVEVAAKERELERGAYDPEGAPLVFATRNEQQKYAIKRVMDRARDGIVTQADIDVLNLYTDAQIAALIAWTKAEATDARTKITALFDDSVAASTIAEID